MAVQKQDDQHEHNIQQLCEDTGCCPEDLPRAMNDREEWRERSGISMLPARYDDDDEFKQLKNNNLTDKKHI